jgi:hypothetical protein
MTGKEKEGEERKQDNTTGGSREAKLTSLFFSLPGFVFFFLLVHHDCRSSNTKTNSHRTFEMNTK